MEPKTKHLAMLGSYPETEVTEAITVTDPEHPLLYGAFGVKEFS